MQIQCRRHSAFSLVWDNAKGPDTPNACADSARQWTREWSCIANGDACIQTGVEGFATTEAGMSRRAGGVLQELGRRLAVDFLPRGLPLGRSQKCI